MWARFNKQESGSVLDALKGYVTGTKELVSEMYVRLGGLKTIRILLFYPGAEAMIRRQLSWVLCDAVAEPDATVWMWKEESFRELPDHALGRLDFIDSNESDWLEIFCDDGISGSGTLCGTVDMTGKWNAHFRIGNEFFYGINSSMGPGDWLTYGNHIFYEAFFRIMDTPSSAFIHGACVGTGDNGLLICARGGRGKSTLSVLAMLRGFSYVSDDYMVMASTDHGLAISPIYSYISLSPDMYDRMFDDLGKARFLGVSPWKGKYIIDISAYSDRLRSNYPIKAAVFPQIDTEAAQPSIRPCTPMEKNRAIVQVAHSTLSQIYQKAFAGGQADPAFILKTVRMLSSGLPFYHMTLCPDLDANVGCLESFASNL